MSKIRTGLVLGALATVMCAGAAFAGGGAVKLRTDNGSDGYFYSGFGGALTARFGGFYDSTDVSAFDPNALICGVRLGVRMQFPLISAPMMPNVIINNYQVSGDLFLEDPNIPTYAWVGNPIAKLATADANTVSTCTNSLRTLTFGGGAGVPDPVARFLVTYPKPAGGNFPGTDFCGVSIDTSLFTNSSRLQGYLAGGPYASGGFNHFVEAVVLEPKVFDVNMTMTGSSRFAGDRGLPVMFARRVCSSILNCKTDGSDITANNKTDDFITARIAVDNNDVTDKTFAFDMTADRSVLNPNLGPKNVVNFFKPIGGCCPAPTGNILMPVGRSQFLYEIKIAIKRKFLKSFPVDLPFTVAIVDPNDANAVPDSEAQALGLRTNAGYYDRNAHDALGGVPLVSRMTVVTGDALQTRFDALDLPKPGDTTNVQGAQIVGGESVSGLPGIDAFELRREDAILAGEPDMSPQGLIRSSGVVGDPLNADGLVLGPPVTTTNIDFTDYVDTPINGALAQTLFAQVYLNPGDTGIGAGPPTGSAGATGIIGSSASDTFISNSSIVLGFGLPSVALDGQQAPQIDWGIRLDLEGELGNPALPRRVTRETGNTDVRVATEHILINVDEMRRLRERKGFRGR